MKVGIKKLQENEWLVHIGCGAVKMDQFSVALLNITLEHLLALQHDSTHSTLDSYAKLGLRMKLLKPLDLQKLLRVINTKDLLVLMLVAKDQQLNSQVIDNVGGILAKQVERDMQTATIPDEESAKDAIRNIVEKTFELEALGDIEFVSENTRYI